MVKGSCLCGAVQFELVAPLREAIACHCTQCRKTSGHYWSATSVPHERFHLTADRGLRWFRSSQTARRGFCGDCGASLFWQPDDEPRIAVAAGALDKPTGIRETLHIFCDDRGDYYDLPDGVACRGQW